MQFNKNTNPIRAIRTNSTLKKTITAETTLCAAIVTTFASITEIIEPTLPKIIVLPNLHTHFEKDLLPKHGKIRRISTIKRMEAEMIAKIVAIGMIFIIKPK